jgi:hypothetical protein
MADINTNIFIITLNRNNLNTLIKLHRLSVYIKMYNPIICGQM